MTSPVTAQPAVIAAGKGLCKDPVMGCSVRICACSSKGLPAILFITFPAALAILALHRDIKERL